MPHSLSAMPSSLPQVSIIIPAYNGERYIVQAIESVLNQTYGNYEIIVVDDGSTDGTPRVLAPYFKRIRYITQENQGVATARNRGIQEAKGEIIAFLDQDDYFLPDKLDAQVAVFLSRPSLGMVHSGWRTVDHQGKPIVDVQPWVKIPQLNLESWILHKPIFPGAWMVRKQWLERAGGFDPQYHLTPDLDLALRLALMGCESAWLEQVTVCYRQHQDNASRNMPEQARELEIVLDRLFARPDLPSQVRALEKHSRYISQVWLAGRLYCSEFPDLAMQYLEKSLSHTPYLPARTLCDWLEQFGLILGEYGNHLEIYDLGSVVGWRQLIQGWRPGKDPQISVVIPTYNSARYVTQAINSVLVQTYLDYEIVVVDDGSTDNTRQVLEPYFDYIRYIYQENAGVSAARNRGIREAKGKWVAFLDADDYYLPEKLAQQIAQATGHPNLAIINSGWRLVDEQGEPLSDCEPWKHLPELDLETWVLEKPVLPSAMMFSRQWLEKAGGFDSRFDPVEDIDLVLRLVIMGGEGVWTPNVTVCYRQHSSNASRNAIRQAKQYEAVLDRFFNRTDLPAAIRKLEPRSRYKSLVWSAWRLSMSDCYVEMVEYLQKSLNLTTDHPLAAVATWASSLLGMSVDSGKKVDGYWLANLPEWQQLIQKIPKPVKPRVSVVIPTYNCDRYLERALTSVFSQTCRDWELIVVDDGSTDRTQEKLAPFRDLITYVYQENQGAAVARNRGCELATGEFLAFLDADDYFLEEKLAKQIACFDTDPSLDMVQAGWVIVDQDEQGIYGVEPWIYAPQLDLKSFVLYKFVRPSAMMLRREWWSRLGGFDPRFPPAEDLDFALRLALKGCKAIWLKELLTCYRQHDHNLMSSGAVMKKNLDRVMENFFARPDLPENIRNLKSQERYGSLVWTAWRLYRDGYPAQMIESLEQSLAYSPFSPTETILNWIECFKVYSMEYGYDFDVYTLTNLPEWQDFMLVVVSYRRQPQERSAKIFLKSNRHILVYAEDHGVGGMALFNHSLLCRLVSEGYQVTSVQSQTYNPLIEEQRQLGVEHVWLEFDTMKDLSRIAYNVDDAEKIFGQTQPDLIIFSDGWPMANLAAKQVAIKQKIPYLIALGYMEPSFAKFTRSDDICYNDAVAYQYAHARAVIAVSHENLNLFKKIYKLPLEQGSVIYYGRPDHYFTPPNPATRQRLRRELDIPEDAVLCFTAARMTPIKGYKYQLQAIEQLKQQPIWSKLYFAWAGAGATTHNNMEPEMRETVAKLGVTDRVKFLGQRWDIPDWLEACDIFILSSEAEGMPLAIMEAMAKGLPVIASAVSGIPEELGETGKLLPNPKLDPAGTVQELVKTIELWASDSELRQTLGKACYERASKLFREERMLQEYLEVITKSFLVNESIQPSVPQALHARIQLVEQRMQHSYFVWHAWDSYRRGDVDGMVNHLRQSLAYTPFLATETISKWLESFASFSAEKGEVFDTYTLINLAEWQQVVEMALYGELAITP